MPPKGPLGQDCPTAAKRSDNFATHRLKYSFATTRSAAYANVDSKPPPPTPPEPASFGTSSHMPRVISNPPPGIPTLVTLASFSLAALPPLQASRISVWSTAALGNLAMASFRRTPGALLILTTVLCVASFAQGQVFLSKLPKALIVTATMAGGGPITAVKTGKDSITVTWKVNTTAAPITTATQVRTKLCFAKESQLLRGWRKTVDNLKLDKTCLYNIALAPYSTAGATATYKLPRSVPGARYFVRAYALNATGTQVAFGQTSPDKVANTFTVIPITGRHASIDIAVAVLSVFSVGSLFGFFIFERMWLQRKKAV